ncbi:MAG: flagellar biosynthesis protein FlhF, partial [Pyrinomonadaceae bacterium]|nr:flagellar biosynthesis protein FlhF [Pyrinomonadaceae bacterium]
MNIKKYRAATTREALEQIKLDLGEDALVLETKQVRNGGFLGFGAETQIEISAAVTSNSEPIQPQRPPKSAGQFNNPLNILHLTDDAPAIPQYNEEKKKLLNNLKISQGMEGFSRKTPLPPVPKILGTIPQRAFSPIEAVEINPSAPRIVHLKKETPPPIGDEQTVPEKKTFETSPTAPATSREFEILRAELREVKFSLGSLSVRRSPQFSHSDFDLETLGEFLDSPFYESYTEFISKGISPELARRMISGIIPQVKSGTIAAEQISRRALLQTVTEAVKFEPDPLDSDGRIIFAVIGATGVGKTTTIAKLAACMSLHKRRRVELITLDTYRIAAVEQLKTYAEIIGAGCHVARSIFEMEAILRRMPVDADIFIDTTGKNPHDLADQYEIS